LKPRWRCGWERIWLARMSGHRMPSPGRLNWLAWAIARSHHRGVLVDAQVGLAQPHAMLFGQTHEPLDRRMHELAVGGESDGLGLHGGVHRHALEITRAQRRPYAPPLSSRPGAVPACRRTASSNGRAPSAHVERRAGRTPPPSSAGNTGR
jgi:hypothetical protein